MRKFVLITEDFSGLGFALDHRLKENDDKVIVAYNPKMEDFDCPEEFERYKLNGKGLVPTFPLPEIMKRRAKMKDWYFIPDRNHSVKEIEILKKEGFKVGLGGKLPEKMENDREFGIKLAESLGLKSPEWKAFKSMEEGIKFLEANYNKAYVYKPNGKASYLTTVPKNSDSIEANTELRKFIKSIGINDFILQEREKGVEVNLEYMCVEGEVKSAYLNLECKRISSNDQGCMTGCAFDVGKSVALDSRIVQHTIVKLLPLIKKLKFTGFADLNCIIGENEVWFIEWCWRAGYNAHPNYFINIEQKDFLNCIADMVDKKYEPKTNKFWGSSITVYTDHPFKGTPIDISDKVMEKCHMFDGFINKDGNLCQSGWKNAANEIAIVCGYGTTIKESFEEAYENVKKVEFINKDYRPDAFKDDYPSAPIKRWEALQGLGLV